MRQSSLKPILILGALTSVLVVANIMVFRGRATGWLAASVSRPASALFRNVHVLKETAGMIERFRSLADENHSLQDQRQELQSKLASQEALIRENATLRAALDLKRVVSGALVPAGVFHITMSPDGAFLFLNKGAADGISPQGVVVTPQGALVGRVVETQAHVARVRALNDLGFEITAKVLGGATAGIARGALGEGLVFDLIVQEDAIKEGDSIVSMGSDVFPPALVIGTVEHVEIDESKLFKRVRIKPAFSATFTGQVMVLVQ